MFEFYVEDMPSNRTIQKWKKKMIDRDWSIFDLQREGGHERTDLVEKI